MTASVSVIAKTVTQESHKGAPPWLTAPGLVLTGHLACRARIGHGRWALLEEFDQSALTSGRHVLDSS